MLVRMAEIKSMYKNDRIFNSAGDQTRSTDNISLLKFEELSSKPQFTEQNDCGDNLGNMDRRDLFCQIPSLISIKDENIVNNNSRSIAHEIFNAHDNSQFNENSKLGSVMKYYKYLITNKYKNKSEYNLKHVLKIIISYLNLDYDNNSFAIEFSSEKLVHKNGYSIVGPGYHIVKLSNDEKLSILTQQEKLDLGIAAKLYNRDIRYKNQHNKSKKPELKVNKISVRDNRGRYSTKYEISLNEPLIDLTVSSYKEINPSEKNIEFDTEDECGEIIIRDDNSNSISQADFCFTDINYDLLYYTDNNPIKELNWNGSYLGHFDKDEFKIIKTQETLGNKFILINIKSGNKWEQFWTEYVKLTDKDHPNLISAIDEWKPLFGLEKIGTHSIVLDKKKYMLFKAPKVSTAFKINKKLSEIDPRAVKGDHLDQIRKILLFKYLIGGSMRSNQGLNIIKFDMEKCKFYSVGDFRSLSKRNTEDLPKGIINNWLTDNLEQEGHLKILASYLKSLLDIVTMEDLEIKPSLLRSKMEDIGRSINAQGESNYCISFVISRVQALLDSTF